MEWSTGLSDHSSVAPWQAFSSWRLAISLCFSSAVPALEQLEGHQMGHFVFLAELVGGFLKWVVLGFLVAKPLGHPTVAN